MALLHDLLDIVWKTAPSWRLVELDSFDPLDEFLVSPRLGNRESLILWLANSWLEQPEIRVVALRSEELVHERVQNLVVEFVVNLAAEDGLRDECAESIPRDLVRVYICAVLTHAVEPFVDAVKRAPLIALIELVGLRPANRRVPDSLLDDRVEPGDQEV